MTLEISSWLPILEQFDVATIVLFRALTIRSGTILLTTATQASSFSFCEWNWLLLHLYTEPD
jgi:hypothetical protein